MTLTPFGERGHVLTYGPTRIAYFWHVRATSRRNACVYWRLDREPDDVTHDAPTIAEAARRAERAWLADERRLIA